MTTVVMAIIPRRDVWGDVVTGVRDEYHPATVYLPAGHSAADEALLQGFATQTHPPSGVGEFEILRHPAIMPASPHHDERLIAVMTPAARPSSTG